MSQLMRLWYLSHRQPGNAQANLRIRAVSAEPSLLSHTWSMEVDEGSVNHQKILPRSNTQLYYNNGGHNNNLKTLRRFHDVDDVTVKDNQ